MSLAQWCLGKGQGTTSQRRARDAKPGGGVAAAVALGLLTLLLGGCDEDADPCEGTVNLPSDSLEEFSAKCFEAIGLDVPAFNCDDGTLVPTTNVSEDEFGNLLCDNPNVLSGVCDPGSRFQILAQTDDAIVVAHCRKKNQGENYGDIAVIQYNQVNGATCFYQALDSDLPALVTAPREGITPEFPWLPPETTAGINCVACHDNGPFIRSPYLGQLRDVEPNPETGFVDRLPGTNADDPVWGRRFEWNQNEPYSFVGNDFQSWQVFSVQVEGNLCTECHRLAISKSNGVFNAGDGTASRFGLIATAETQASKNPHSAESPIWMLPDETAYSTDMEILALEIANCADALIVGEVSPDGCTALQFGGGDTCEVGGGLPAAAPAPPPPVVGLNTEGR